MAGYPGTTNYTDLTDTFNYKDLLTWQNMDALAENDDVFKQHMEAVGSGTSGATNPHGLIGDDIGVSAIAFGAWATKNKHTVYQADTDGLLIGYFQSYVEGGFDMYIKTDSSNPPTTIRQRLCRTAGSIDRFSFACAVKKNDYYKIDGSANNVIAFWISLGT